MRDLGPLISIKKFFVEGAYGRLYRALKSLFHLDMEDEWNYDKLDFSIHQWEAMPSDTQKIYVRDMDYNLRSLEHTELDFSARSNYILVLNGVILLAIFTLIRGDFCNCASAWRYLAYSTLAVAVFLTILSTAIILWCIIHSGYFNAEFDDSCINGIDDTRKRQYLLNTFDLTPSYYTENGNPPSYYEFDEVKTKYYFYKLRSSIAIDKSLILSASGRFSAEGIIFLMVSAFVYIVCI